MPKKVKVKLSETQLVEIQAQRMLRDMHRLQATQSKSADAKSDRTSVDVWKDTDFFFSVVFQSSAQKYKFLEEFSKKFELGVDSAKSGDEVIQVINGLQLAGKLGILLTGEKVGEYPYPNLELKNMALDSEKF